MPQVALVAGAVASVAGTAVQISSTRRAQRLQQRQQEVATRRSRRQAIREAQIRRAQSLVSAQGSGSMDSSGAVGGIGSLGSQLGEALGFSTQMSGLSRGIASAQSRAAVGQSLTRIGGALYGYGQNQGATFQDVFSASPNRPPQMNFGSTLYGNSAYPQGI